MALPTPTTGYGHISPLTTTGRIFLVFYALLGIPLTMLLLGGLGGRLARLKSTSRAGAFLMAAIIWVGEGHTWSQSTYLYSIIV